jgi:hypothetical protein
LETPRQFSARESEKHEGMPKVRQLKGLGQFPRNPARNDGLSSWCKACHAEPVRRTRAKKAEQEAERAEALRLEINERLGEQARRRREQLQRLGLA